MNRALERSVPTRRETALALYGQGYSCSQAILAIFGPDFGLSRATALRLAAPLTGGLAGICCASLGGFLVLGLAFGSSLPETNPGGARLEAALTAFRTRLTALHGGLHCVELLCRGAARRRGEAEEPAFAICPRFVVDVVDILEDLLGA